jgi:hypothetical protein
MKVISISYPAAGSGLAYIICAGGQMVTVYRRKNVMMARIQCTVGMA